LTDWIIHDNENNRNCICRRSKQSHDGTGICQDNIWRERDQFRDMSFNSLWISARVPILDLNIPPIDPTRITHTQLKCPDTRFRFGIIFGNPKQYANLSHPLATLRMRPRSGREMPRR
jgi:hypothetical protein